jgi:hypothetical protein
MMKNASQFRWDFLSLILVIGSFALSGMLFSFENKNNERKINPAAAEMINSVREGDLIFVDSDDFVSKMVKDIDNCSFSSYKIAFKNLGETRFLISDIDNLADNTQGLYTGPAIEYFQSYNDLRIALYRPKEFTAQHVKKLDALINLSRSRFVNYDLAFNNDDRTTMTCEKNILAVYGEDAMFRDNENKYPYRTTLPCDINLEKFDKIHDWISFWQ